MKQGVLLLAHGAPERVEDVPQYLSYVRGGQPVSAHVMEEVKSRYAAIGGSSPLTHWTRVQAEALQGLTGLPVLFGMRNWHPFVKESMEEARAAGIERLACICLAPQFAEMSIGLYMKHAQSAAEGIELVWAHSYHDEPELLDAFAERLGTPKGRVLFTAHSLPAPNDRYEEEARATAEGVAKAAGIHDWDFAFQSQGMSGGKWLSPTVESCLDRYAAEGLREVTLQPIGFVCDHVEILYDVDIHFRTYATERGITLHRPESLNGSPLFTQALAAVLSRVALPHGRGSDPSRARQQAPPEKPRGST